MKTVCRRYPDWLNFELDFPTEIHLQYPEFPFDPKDGVYRVYCDSFEPSTSCANPKQISKILPLYDLILTKNENIVLEHPNSKLFLFGNSMMYPDVPVRKEFSVSFLTTKPNWHLPGYDLRYELWGKQDEILIPKVFYSSRRMPIDSSRILPGDGGDKDKMLMFESMFHIAIENTNEKNYFTEKINDCFWTETVPLYWGNKDTINSKFDSRGVIHFQSIPELIELCNSLTPDDYTSRLESIKNNKELSKEYSRHMNERIRDEILMART